MEIKDFFQFITGGGYKKSEPPDTAPTDHSSGKTKPSNSAYNVKQISSSIPKSVLKKLSEQLAEIKKIWQVKLDELYKKPSGHPPVY